MNETLQNALAEILIKATETAEVAGAFVVAELPDVVQQLLMWKMVESIAMCLVGVLILIPSAVLLYRGITSKIPYFDQNDEPTAKMALTIIGGLAAILPGGFGFAALNLDWLQILIAPKIYLIEYAASLAGK